MQTLVMVRSGKAENEARVNAKRLIDKYTVVPQPRRLIAREDDAERGNEADDEVENSGGRKKRAGNSNSSIEPTLLSEFLTQESDRRAIDAERSRTISAPNLHVGLPPPPSNNPVGTNPTTLREQRK